MSDMANTPPLIRIWPILVVGATATAVFLGMNSLANQNTKTQVAVKMTSGDPSKAPLLMRRFGCAGCHAIPGVASADGLVGPPLSGLSERVYIGGVLVNSSENLVEWIVSPEQFSPQTAMPTTGINSQEARDVAAYLYAH